MSGMEEALVARLDAADGVGGVNAWGDLPRASALPATSLTFIAPGRDWTHSGPTNIDQARVQFDCWGATSIAALARARATLTEMEQERTIGGVTFHPAQLEGRMGPEREDAADGKVWRVMLDLNFYHEPEGAGA